MRARAAVIPDDWRQEFEAAARRPLATRLRYAFIHTYKPVLDDAPYRAFATLAEYRAWCLFIGKSGAILLGLPDTSQDADLFVDRSPENGRALADALKSVASS